MESKKLDFTSFNVNQLKAILLNYSRNFNNLVGYKSFDEVYEYTLKFANEKFEFSGNTTPELISCHLINFASGTKSCFDKFFTL